MITGSLAAAVLHPEQSAFSIQRFGLSAPPPGAAVLRMVYSGICGTDVHIVQKKLVVSPRPIILGHEFIGRVEALGAGAETDGLGTSLKVGDAVVASVALPCGKCFNCRNDEPSSCTNFGVTYFADPSEAPHFHGGFAEALVSPAANLVRIPGAVNLKAAASACCAGPTVLRALEYAGGFQENELVVVQGTGMVGLFAIALAASKGCRVMAIGSQTPALRSELARALGAENVLDRHSTTETERLEIIKSRAAAIHRGDGADLVFEASGSPQAFREGLNLTRTRGRFVVPGQYSNQGNIEIAPQGITFKALRIIGSGQNRLTDVGVYLEFLLKNPEKAAFLTQAVDARFSVAQTAEAMECAAAGQSLKTVLKGERGE